MGLRELKGSDPSLDDSVNISNGATLTIDHDMMCKEIVLGGAGNVKAPPGKRYGIVRVDRGVTLATRFGIRHETVGADESGKLSKVINQGTVVQLEGPDRISWIPDGVKKGPPAPKG